MIFDGYMLDYFSCLCQIDLYIFCLMKEHFETSECKNFDQEMVQRRLFTTSNTLATEAFIFCTET